MEDCKLSIHIPPLRVHNCEEEEGSTYYEIGVIVPPKFYLFMALTAIIALWMLNMDRIVRWDDLHDWIRLLRGLGIHVYLLAFMVTYLEMTGLFELGIPEMWWCLAVTVLMGTWLLVEITISYRQQIQNQDPYLKRRWG